MSVAIIVPKSWEPSKLVHWSTTIARAMGEDLLILRLQQQASSPERIKTRSVGASDDSVLAATLREHAGDFDLFDLNGAKDRKCSLKNGRRAETFQPCIYLRQLNCVDVFERVLKEIKSQRIKLLIVPRHKGVRLNEDEFTAQRQLILDAPCQTLLLRPGTKVSDECESVLVATSRGKNASPALLFGAVIAASNEKELTALHVEHRPDVGSRFPGQRFVKRIVGTQSSESNQYPAPDAVVDTDFASGVNSYATVNGHDLVIVGPNSSGAGRQFHTSVSERLLANTEEPTVVVVRGAISTTGRFLRLIERRKKSLVPQLDREGRVELVQRIQSSAKWDFDFMFLICLATLIAALGLALNSTPVVIGAMLVAPLMSPMLGVGLSVVQGNRYMANDCMTTIRRGFLLAFLTGVIIGIFRILFTTGITEEMASRGAPGILDLGVAFFSGVVAAYAFGRPHLLTVLPGIAIATSLIPPVATAGLSLCAFDLEVALGATLLFLSNFVAIVLGSASSLWFVGMRGPREICPFTAWALQWMAGFSVVAVALALYFTVQSLHSPLDVSSVVQQRVPAEPSPMDTNLAGNQPQTSDRPPLSSSTEDGVAAQELPDRDRSFGPLRVFRERREKNRGKAPILDAILATPNQTQTGEAERVEDNQRGSGKSTADTLPLERFAEVLRRLAAEREEAEDSPESSDLYDLLVRYITQQIAEDSTAPM